MLGLLFQAFLSLATLGEAQDLCLENQWLPENMIYNPGWDCEYDGSRVPNCSAFIQPGTGQPYFHRHEYDCSKFWECGPNGETCMFQCPPCGDMCPGYNGLSFDCRYHYPYGPVCDFPLNVNCENQNPCPSCDSCQDWQICDKSTECKCSPECREDPDCAAGEYCDPNGVCQLWSSTAEGIFTVTCDNILQVWIDGVYHEGAEDANWRSASSFVIPKGSKVLAVNCLNTGYEYGLLGSSSTGILTGESGWVCSAEEQTDWQEVNFNDKGWVSPHVEGPHGMGPWGSIEGIDRNAEWIWTDNAAQQIWCRYNLGTEPDNCASQSYQILDHESRSVNYGWGDNCDLSGYVYQAKDWKGPGWYRFAGPDYSQLATSPPGLGHCGASVTGWLDGVLPTVAQGEQEMKVCWQYNAGECMPEYTGIDWSNTTITVLNCSDFYIYKLPEVPSCRLKYCGA